MSVDFYKNGYYNCDFCEEKCHGGILRIQMIINRNIHYKVICSCCKFKVIRCHFCNCYFDSMCSDHNHTYALNIELIDHMRTHLNIANPGIPGNHAYKSSDIYQSIECYDRLRDNIHPNKYTPMDSSTHRPRNDWNDTIKIIERIHEAPPKYEKTI